MSFWAVPETVSVGAEVTSAGRLFQRRLPDTGNARSPTVDSHVLDARMTTTGDGGG